MVKNQITYEFTWCDFLTPCPHGNDCMVGDCDCLCCQHFISTEILKPIYPCGTESYSTYFDVGVGVVNCSFNKKK